MNKKWFFWTLAVFVIIIFIPCLFWQMDIIYGILFWVAGLPSLLGSHGDKRFSPQVNAAFIALPVALLLVAILDFVMLSCWGFHPLFVR